MVFRRCVSSSTNVQPTLKAVGHSQWANEIQVKAANEHTVFIPDAGVPANTKVASDLPSATPRLQRCWMLPFREPCSALKILKTTQAAGVPAAIAEASAF